MRISPPTDKQWIVIALVECALLAIVTMILSYKGAGYRIELERANKRIETLENRLDAINKRTDSLELFQWRQEAMAEKRKGKR